MDMRSSLHQHAPARDRTENPPTSALLRWALPAACLLAGGALAAIGLADVPDPVEVPVAPRWFAAVLALVTAVLTLPTGRPASRRRTTVAAVTGAGMLSASLPAVPHSVLMLVVTALSQVTGAEGGFETEIPWAAVATHLAVTATGILLALWAVVQHRVRLGRCAWCGRLDAEPPAVGVRTRRALRWLAVVAVAAALPYTALKLAWGLGSRIGAVGDSFDGVTLATPGYGDTVLLGALAVFVSVVMGAGVMPRTAGQKVLHLVSATFGTIGSLMLLPVSVVGVVMMVVAPPASGGEIAPWIFTLVYVGFIVWGLSLAPLTALYLRATRQTCRRHRPGTVAGRASGRTSAQQPVPA
jgi:hypothetical protein